MSIEKYAPIKNGTTIIIGIRIYAEILFGVISLKN
jgi:hypothetical protein